MRVLSSSIPATSLNPRFGFFSVVGPNEPIGAEDDFCSFLFSEDAASGLPVCTFLSHSFSADVEVFISLYF